MPERITPAKFILTHRQWKRMSFRMSVTNGSSFIFSLNVSYFFTFTALSSIFHSFTWVGIVSRSTADNLSLLQYSSFIMVSTGSVSFVHTAVGLPSVAAEVSLPPNNAANNMIRMLFMFTEL